MKNLENLIEMIEMQNELDMLIEEAIGDLTVNEFNMLNESGILVEAGLRAKYDAAKGIAKSVGRATGVLKNIDNTSDYLKQFKKLHDLMPNSKIAKTLVNNASVFPKIQRGVRLAGTATAAAGTAYAGNKLNERRKQKQYEALPFYKKAMVNAKQKIDSFRNK